MKSVSGRRGVIYALLAIASVLIVALVYTVNHDKLWNRGPINALFHAAPAPDPQNSVGITSQVRDLLPDGTARSDVEALLADEGFACTPAPEPGEANCRRSPLGIVCTETWFVSYGDMSAPVVNVTHASKSVKCPWA